MQHAQVHAQVKAQAQSQAQVKTHAQAQAQVQAHVRASAQSPSIADQSCLHGRPVIWRWVPHVSHPASLPAPTENPRVIYATAKRVNNKGPEELSHLLTGGELQEAREELIRNKVDSLVASVSTPSASTLRIPNVPTMLSRHTDLARQSLLEQSNHTSELQRTTAGDAPKATKGGVGGELEVANLLLNMGGSSPTTETPSATEKETSKSKKGSSEIGSPKKANSPSKQSASAAQKPPILQDLYLDNWVEGSVSLHTPEEDDVLSPLHCFMRRYCVEAFSATVEDVATPRYGKSHGFKVEIGQVGIRCLHCKDCPPGKRAERAVCYPSSLRNIYHSIETWQRRHSFVCKHITPWVRKSILKLMESSKTRAGGRRQYWEDSARRLGMVDTSRGVRFSRNPGYLGPIPSLGSSLVPGASDAPQHKPEKVVRTEDKDLVTDYLFLLMDQMQTCRFTEEDRTGGRSKIKDNEVGFPGMECRHCQGRAGFGRYFPSSVAALSLANSDRNVYNHLQKCRRCPEEIKKELVRLQNNQSQGKNRRGLRKLFFNRIWTRIHGDNENSNVIKPKAMEKEQGSTPSHLVTGLVAAQKQPSPEGFRPYTGMQRSLPQLAAPPMMAHPYHHNMHPQVAVHNFRGF